MSDKVSTGVTDQTASEIAACRRIENELRQSEREIAEAQRVARLGSWKWDLVNDELSWSAELFRIYGYDPESDVPSQAAFLDRVHPDDRALIDDHLADLISKGEPCSVDLRILLPDGSTQALFSDRGGTIRTLVGVDPEGVPAVSVFEDDGREED